MDSIFGLAGSVTFLVLLLLVFLSRRARRHGGAYRAGVVGAMYELHNRDRQQALDVIVKDEAAATDPETADGDLPQLEKPAHRPTTQGRV